MLYGGKKHEGAVHLRTFLSVLVAASPQDQEFASFRESKYHVDAFQQEPSSAMYEPFPALPPSRRPLPYRRVRRAVSDVPRRYPRYSTLDTTGGTFCPHHESVHSTFYRSVHEVSDPIHREMSRSDPPVQLHSRKSIDPYEYSHELPTGPLSNYTYESFDPSSREEWPWRDSHVEGYHQRTRNFVLTRILLRFVADMCKSGDISLSQKSYLKDLIIDQDPMMLAAAEIVDQDNDVNEVSNQLVFQKQTF